MLPCDWMYGNIFEKAQYLLLGLETSGAFPCSHWRSPASALCWTQSSLLTLTATWEADLI